MQPGSQEEEMNPVSLSVSDLLPQAQFELREPSVVQCEGKKLRWIKKKETTVLLDHVVLEGIVSVEWKVVTAGKDSSIELGFAMDVLGDGCADEQSQNIYASYKNSGMFKVRSLTRHLDGFRAGDIIRLELDMITRDAQFFKNNHPVPLRIAKIPQVNKFFLRASGTDTTVELLSLLQLFEHTPVSKALISELVQMDKLD